MWRPSTPIAAFLASLAWAVGPAAAADDVQFLEGLRARGLWELAERHCSDLLADPRIDDQRRAELTIELARTLAGQALESPDSPDLWLRAKRVVDDFAVRHPRHPRLILVRLQGALVEAARGEALAETLDASSEPEVRDATRKILRAAIGELDELSGEIAAQLRRRGRREPGEGELSAAELQSLEVSVQVELARALRHQALSYAAGTADRIHSLSRALELLDEMLRRKPATPLVWSAALEEIACLRLLGEYPQAERRLAALDKNEPPAEFAERLQAERIRLALARDRVDEALSEAGASGPRPPGGADLELARLEALLAAWRRAAERRDESETADYQRRAVEQARGLGRWHGARSMSRAETLLARTMADAAGPQSAELLAQAAASYYRGGQLDKAVAAYDRASKKARDQRQPAKAFDLGLTAATIEKQREHFGEALTRYRALAHAFPDEPKAPDAHLLAIYCAAQHAQEQNPPDLAEYERLLHQHVSTWPASRTASQAWMWLGRLAEHRRRWQDAIAALTHIKPEDPQFGEAVAALAVAMKAGLTKCTTAERVRTDWPTRPWPGSSA